MIRVPCPATDGEIRLCEYRHRPGNYPLAAYGVYRPRIAEQGRTIEPERTVLTCGRHLLMVLNTARALSGKQEVYVSVLGYWKEAR